MPPLPLLASPPGPLPSVSQRFLDIAEGLPWRTSDLMGERVCEGIVYQNSACDVLVAEFSPVDEVLGS